MSVIKSIQSIWKLIKTIGNCFIVIWYYLLANVCHIINKKEWTKKYTFSYRGNLCYLVGLPYWKARDWNVF